MIALKYYDLFHLYDLRRYRAGWWNKASKAFFYFPFKPDASFWHFDHMQVPWPFDLDCKLAKRNLCKLNLFLWLLKSSYFSYAIGTLRQLSLWPSWSLQVLSWHPWKGRKQAIKSWLPLGWSKPLGVLKIVVSK